MEKIIIIPEEIKQQANEMIKALEECRDKLNVLKFPIDSFMNCVDLQGAAWSAIKDRFGEHILVINGLECVIDIAIEANRQLIDRVGDEVLNTVKLEQTIENIDRVLDIYHEKLEYYVSLMSQPLFSTISANISVMCRIFEEMIDNMERLRKLALEKIERAISIENETKDLASQVDFSFILQAIAALNNARTATSFSSVGTPEWKMKLSDIYNKQLEEIRKDLQVEYNEDGTLTCDEKKLQAMMNKDSADITTCEYAVIAEIYCFTKKDNVKSIIINGCYSRAESKTVGKGTIVTYKANGKINNILSNVNTMISKALVPDSNGKYDIQRINMLQQSYGVLATVSGIRSLTTKDGRNSIPIEYTTDSETGEVKLSYYLGRGGETQSYISETCIADGSAEDLIDWYAISTGNATSDEAVNGRIVETTGEEVTGMIIGFHPVGAVLDSITSVAGETADARREITLYDETIKKEAVLNHAANFKLNIVRVKTFSPAGNHYDCYLSEGVGDGYTTYTTREQVDIVNRNLLNKDTGYYSTANEKKIESKPLTVEDATNYSKRWQEIWREVDVKAEDKNPKANPMEVFKNK